jgi:hypothetical protein
MTRPSTPDERKHALIAFVLFLCTAWVYFRVAHHLPVIVDMLFPLWYSPAMLLVLLAVRHKLGLKVRCWSDDTDGNPESHGRLSLFNHHALIASMLVFFTGFWIAMDHTGRFPVDWAVVLIVLGLLGTFLVLCVNVLAGVLRSRRAGRSQ